MTIDVAALRRALIAGTVLQVLFAMLAHLSGWVALHALLFGAMIISAVAGYLYAQRVVATYFASAASGGVAGAVCGLFGLSLSVILGETDPGLMFPNALMLAATGAIGALFGRMAGPA